MPINYAYAHVIVTFTINMFEVINNYIVTSNQ